MGWTSASISSNRPSRAAGANESPTGDEWLEGRGVAIHAQDCAPPTEHRSEAHLTLLPDGTYHLAVGSARIRQRHQQCAAAGRRLGAEHAGGDRRHGLRRHGPHALRHGHIRQHGHQRGDARRPAGPPKRCGRICSNWPAGFERARRPMSPRGRSRALRGPIALTCKNSTPPHRFGTNSTCRARCTAHPVPRPFWPMVFASPCIASPARSASCRACRPSTPARSSTPCRRAGRSRAESPRGSAPRCSSGW